MNEQRLLKEDLASLLVFGGRGKVKDFGDCPRQDWAFEQGFCEERTHFGRVNLRCEGVGSKFAGGIHLIWEQKERVLGRVSLDNPREGARSKV